MPRQSTYPYLFTDVYFSLIIFDQISSKREVIVAADRSVAFVVLLPVSTCIPVESGTVAARRREGFVSPAGARL